MLANQLCKLFILIFCGLLLSSIVSMAEPTGPPMLDDGSGVGYADDAGIDRGDEDSLADDEASGAEIFLDSNGDKYVFDRTTQKTYRLDSVSESTRALESRLQALESSKQDLSIWITIFVTSVILIIGINIGLSAWQVGSIAQREAEDYMKEYEKNFQKLINETIAQIDEKVSNYENNLNELVSRINELGPKFDSSLEKSEKAINNLASFADKSLMDFKIETQKTKSNIIEELEKWQEKKLKKLTPVK